MTDPTHSNRIQPATEANQASALRAQRSKLASLRQRHLRRPPLAHLASLVFDAPLAIIPEKLEVLLRVFGPRLTSHSSALSHFLDEGGLYQHASAPSDKLLEYVRVHGGSGSGVDYYDDPDLDPDHDGDADSFADRPYEVTDAGIAIIPISGVLLKKGTWMSSLSGCCGYDEIGRSVTRAVADPQVQGLLLDIDSPGGTTHGCFELSDLIYSAARSSSKPIWSIANDLAASAAYAIASATDRIYVTRTGGVGSVGVFCLHVDQSGADEQAGVKFTYIYAGDHKIDGNPHEPLSRSAQKSTQLEIDREYAIFTRTVARNRGADVTKIIGTQAEVLFADASIPLLADKVGTYETALEDLTSKLSRSNATIRRSTTIGTRVGTDTGLGPKSTDIAQTATAEMAEGADVMATIAEFQNRFAALLAEMQAAGISAAAAKKADGDKKECPECGGTGEVDGETCDACHGTGEVGGKKAKKAEAEDADEKKAKKLEDAAEASDAAAEGKKKAAARRIAAMTSHQDSLLHSAAASASQLEVQSLCNLAGLPNLAADFILAETPLAEIRKVLLEKRAAASAAAAVSGAMTGVQSGSVDTITKQAAAIVSGSNGTMTMANALRQVISSNPQLYENYDEERRFAAETPSRTRQYIASVQSQVKGMGLSTAIDSYSGGAKPF